MSKPYVELPEDRDPKFFRLFTRRKSFYRALLPLLLMIALQQLAALTVNLVDNIMLGTYSELALSGATLVNQLQFILQQVASGIGLGIVVLASQYWGQQRTDPIKKIISIGFKAGILIGLIFFAVTTFFPEPLMRIFTGDAAVLAEGLKYLQIMRWTYLLFAASNSLMYAMQSVEAAAIGTIMSISTICINICLNYTLIFGNFGAPEMGIEGAAVATMISRSVELLIILLYIFVKDRKLKMRPKDLFRFDRTYLNDFIRLSSPVAVTGFLWGVAQAAQTAILGHISSTVIAASSIASVVFQLFVVFGFACSNAASVIIGKTIGEGQLHLVRSYAKTLQGLFLILGILSGLLIFLMKDPIVSVYAISDETRQLTLAFLTILSVTSVFSCYEYPVESGIIGGGGSTKYAAIVDNLFMWLFTIPSALLSAFVFRFPPVVTFCFLKADQLLKCIPNSITCNRFRWVKVLTR